MVEQILGDTRFWFGDLGRPVLDTVYNLSSCPLVMPPRKCPSPILSQPEAISGPSKGLPNAMVLINRGAKNPSQVEWVLQNVETP
ncbi:hypothetical protein DUI87_08122 [Hirundo rustica rustica]|uniref:Uncharacterized protein n=1 Tax=Hirundo rustica rustica TaxID=333673 RepID=A0A3M0L9J8_HIRRU|nr:hypothetical protein DUI87_08122 [Hirundo rustica rustica]